MTYASNDPDEARIGKDLGSREFVADEDMLRDHFVGLEIDAELVRREPLRNAHRALHDADRR